MKSIKSFIFNNKFNLFVVGVWLFITVVSLFNHEIWRDEAQAWCMVRDLDLINIFKLIRIEGHPFLWYLILFPFAKLGFPVISMQIISLLFVFISILFILFKSPFNKFEKIIICFSSGLLYFLPIVARNYALIPVFIFLLAYLYPKRINKAWLYSITLLLLSNTHSLMFGFCGILFCLFSYEKIKEYLIEKDIKLLYPSILLLVNFVILFLMFLSVTTSNYAIQNSDTKNLSFIQTIFQYSEVYFPILFKNAILDSIILYSCFGLIIFSLFQLNKKCAIIFFASLLYHFMVFSKVWFGGVSYQKSFLMLLILIFCVWILKDKKLQNKKLNTAFITLFVISTLFSPTMVLADYGYNFSGGKQTADYIKQNLKDENTFIAVGYPFTFSSISAYLPDKKLYSLNQNYYISYFNFKIDKETEKENPPQNIKYYIVQDDFILNEETNFKKIFVSDETNLSTQKEREIFSIYIKE